MTTAGGFGTVAGMTTERHDLSPAMRALDAEIVRAFDYFNRKHWGGRLVRPVFGYHPNKPNGKTLGHFSAGAWVDPKAAGRRKSNKVREGDEIIFYADLCLSRGFREVMHTLLHEMVHLWQAMYGTIPSGAYYHNEQFHREAQRVGLLSELADRAGHTKDGPGFLADFKAFKPRITSIPFRKGHGAPRGPGGGAGGATGGGGGGAETGEQVPAPGKMLKWVCLCGFGVRVAVPYFNATCNTCESRFVLAPPKEAKPAKGK